MTLTHTPSSSLRPLGEEHLRMFKRTVGSSEEFEKVVIPKSAKARANIVLTKEVGNVSEAAKIMFVYDGRLATLPEFLAVKDSVWRPMAASIFLDWKDSPKREGWYRAIDIINHSFKSIDSDDASELEWRQRVYVHAGVAGAAREKRPLYLHPNNDHCLDLFGDYKPVALGIFALVIPRPPSLPLSRKI